MAPKHSNPKSRTPVCAPYNFIPLPEKVVAVDSVLPDHDRYYIDRCHGRYHGYIECDLVTRSPLYTRCALNPDFFRQRGNKPFHELTEENKETVAQFFHIDDAHRPVIPGSSVRGMVRSLVEIAGYGKMQWVSRQPLVFRAVGDTSSLGKGYRTRFMEETSKDHFEFLVQAGYLHQEQSGKWQIIPAQEVNRVRFGRIESSDIPCGLHRWYKSPTAQMVYAELDLIKPHTHNRKRHPVVLNYAKVMRASAAPGPGLQKMVLVKTKGLQNKHLDYVLGLPDTTTEPIPVPDKVHSAYRNQITQGQESLLGKEGALCEMQPVFYLVENDELVFFGHTMMFRLSYPNTAIDLVPEDLRRPSDIDLAEAIFGFTADKKREHHKEGFAGRVFFTDAVCTLSGEEVFCSETLITPKILATPKPTCFSHYLVQDRTKGHDPDNKVTLAHYGTPVTETLIRGHKLYWHKGNVMADIKNDQKNAGESQLTRVRPVKSGVNFRSRLYFENLSEVELGVLLWVLQLPEDCCHKIGMGKPLGMGAVKITPTLHLTDRRKRYARLFDDDLGWYEAKAKMEDTRRFVRAFEGYMLKELKDHIPAGCRFSDVERIKMLLAMLKWRDSNPEWARYMQIEGANGNEYKDRLVLPDPLHVAGCGRSDVDGSTESRPGQCDKANRPRPGRLYLRIAHVLHGRARKLLYESPVTGELLVFNHDPT